MLGYVWKERGDAVRGGRIEGYKHQDHHNESPVELLLGKEEHLKSGMRRFLSSDEPSVK